MKPLTTLLMIGVLMIPAAATAREHDRGGPAWSPPGWNPPGWNNRGGPPEPRTFAPPNGGYGRPPSNYGAYRGPGPEYRGPPPERGGGSPQMVYRGVPGFGGYARPRVRDPDDWNDFGAERAGPARWRRGEVFPLGARGEIVGDYDRYHLRRPPPGYYWYRSGDDYVLASIASGLIFEVVSGDY